jgi:hypothetical protein
MAIVKATYTRSTTAAKNNVRYIEHRPGKDGAKITRTLFNSDGKLSRKEALQMIDQAERGAYFFRLVISPDPKLEDTEKDIFLRSVTEKTMASLEDRCNKSLQWVAAIHADHTSHRHIHLLAILPERLNVQDFHLLRNAATQEAREQRQELDAAKQRERNQSQEEGLAW